MRLIALLSIPLLAAPRLQDVIARAIAQVDASRQQEAKPLPVPAPAPATNDGVERSFEINDQVVRAVEKGLKWLADRQQADGSWIGDVGFKLNNNYNVVPEGRAKGHVGVTALAGMAFLANGQVPGRGRYGEVIDKALSYVTSCVQENGFITAHETRMYSHAFATLFLAEALGMVKRDDVRERLQDAVRLIIDSQNTEGGWRYVPFAKESDMSITVCQVMALRAARNVGIPVPKATIDRAVAYVKASAVRDGGRRGFGMDSEDERGAFRYQAATYSRSTFPLTAAGIVTLYGAGVYDDRDIELGLDFLERNLRSFSADSGVRGNGHYFFYYGHYYAVQAMYVAGGERYHRYFEHIRRTLLDMQENEGSWPNAVGPGKNFSTAVATLILEIPYRYLPIFQR